VAAPPVTPAPAATVVLVRPAVAGIEVLLTHRPASMAFAPDMHVFPGGRVDPADGSPELAARSVIGAAEAAVRIGGGLSPGEALAAHVAALRELWEEGGVLLADGTVEAGTLADARANLVDGSVEFGTIVAELDLELRTDLLMPLSRWVTPPGYPRRFDARFFAALLPDAADASIASEEVVALGWHTPSAALDAMADGRLGMWLPTSSTLQQLEYVAHPDELERLLPGPLGPIVVDEPAPHVIRVVMPAGGGVAGQPVHAYLVGRRRFVLVDPGDPTGAALERCLELARARGGDVAAIALTHVDPDHHAGAEGLAEGLGIPVLAGPGAARRLPYAVRELVDEAVIDAGDIGLRVLATPGPRPDHLAFAADDLGVVLTGDLDGRHGARSIPPPIDAPALAASAARVERLGGFLRLGGHPAPEPAT
jgi:glyoxylase-like metal-dependent hydrolase (beta-lactamase superfamily II)/8-oxo-dGTP pyrophosphatase MutT (NUDIX family)